MRQKRTRKVVLGVSAVLVACLLVFAAMRRGVDRKPVYVDEDDAKEEQKAADGHSGHDHGEAEEKQDDGDGSPAEQQDEGELSGSLQDGIRVVEMTAKQFSFDPATVLVRSGEKVRLKVTSTDVTHGIAIDDFGVDQKLPPQETKVITFTAGEPGTHEFHCSVFCGSGHGDMTGEIIVRPAPHENGG